MQADPLSLDLPVYQVEYGDEVYSYTGKKGRKNLRKILYRAGGGYCMYCYSRIIFDEKEMGHLEHAIEKEISKKYLTNCIPNIGISCSICNDRYKKMGYSKRIPDMQEIQRFEKNAECRKKKMCKTPCRAYIELKRAYTGRRAGHILLQPLGEKGIDTGEELCIQYDILESQFIPSRKHNYSKRELEFIKDHIDQFHLNTDQSKQFIRFVENVINLDGKYPMGIEYSNKMIELFIKELLAGRSQRERVKLCEKIYLYTAVKFSIPEI